MGGSSKLGTALTVLLAISLAVLFAELFYLLWRRRVYRGTDSGGGREDEASNSSSSECTFSSASSPKELLYYFFCMRPQSRLEHDSVPANTMISGSNSTRQSDMEAIDIDLLKIQGMFGPPRFLFTINEEEREGLESPAEISIMCPVAEKGGNKKKIEDQDQSRGRVSLEECFTAAEETVVEVETGDVDEATPYSTPCASPVYFTPSASPAQDVAYGWSQKDS